MRSHALVEPGEKSSILKLNVKGYIKEPELRTGYYLLDKAVLTQGLFTSFIKAILTTSHSLCQQVQWLIFYRVTNSKHGISVVRSVWGSCNHSSKYPSLREEVESAAKGYRCTRARSQVLTTITD